MKVYALVGKSGTGKSYQAMNLCRDLDIEVIIDDGLLIYGNGILAGTSAKRQETVIGAIKTALLATNCPLGIWDAKLVEQLAFEDKYSSTIDEHLYKENCCGR